MAAALKDSTIRQLAPNDLAKHLRQLLIEHSELTISDYLFSSIQCESLPPNVITIWLSISRTPSTLFRALQQEFSVLVRTVAIKRFAKLLRRKDWWETWDGVGGTQGLLTLIGQFSVAEVKLLLLQLRRCNNISARPEQRTLFTQIFQGILPHLYPNAHLKSTDERPLLHNALYILPACSSEFVDAILRDEANVLFRSGAWPQRTDPVFFVQQYEILRQQCLDSVFKPESSVINLRTFLRPLFRRYPELPSSKKGYSESMLFSLKFLRKLAAEPIVKLSGHNIVQDLIEPLLWRGLKKGIGWEDICEILDLSLSYLSAHSEDTNKYMGISTGIIRVCIKFWASSSIHRVEYEDRLVSMLRMIPREKKQHLQQFAAAIYLVQKPLRYQLLKLFFLNTGEKHIDIDHVESLKDLSVEIWPCKLFQLLMPIQAVGLLNKLRYIKGEGFLDGRGGNTILPFVSIKNVSGASSIILLNLLEQGSPALERARAGVDEQRKKAAQSREQEFRAFHARYALFHAISSGSLGLYSDTFIWAKRFIRDPLTVKSLFSRSACNTEEGIRLLSGLPNDLEHFQGFSSSDIAQRVSEANKLIFDVFEIVCSALKEPSFYLPDWTGLLELLADVVQERFSLSGILQRRLNLSDDEIYQVLWSDTLELALRIEKISVRDEYSPLGLKSPSGLLRPKSSPTELKEKLPSSYRFIDNLAKARNDLWQTIRLSAHPAVITLPVFLPRGLPIQFLTAGINVAVDSADSLTPYIASRAVSVVFAKPDEALEYVPQDDETRSAIGSFVNSFSFALQIYVLQGQTASVRRSRSNRAWEYALEKLSHRMTQQEAHRTWKPIFQQALPDFEIAGPDPETSMEYPLLPFDADIGYYSEWNPGDAFNPPSPIESRQLLPLTFLDCSILMPSTPRAQLTSQFKNTNFLTAGFMPPKRNIWYLERMSRRQLRIPAVQEGLIASALLFLQHYIPNHHNVLLKPFPSENGIRYPDMWLDVSFTESPDVDKVNAFNVLEQLSSIVPPSLLYKLVEAGFSALSSESEKTDATIAQLEQITYGLVSLLAEGDRPSLATKFILQIIIDRPDSSSWHRKLMTKGFLRSLSATQAKVLMRSFADAIQQKMKEQAEFPKQPVESTDNGKSSRQRPYVKVTTIKYLAQILRDADFIPVKFSVVILGDLLKSSSHIDIRAAIVESLLAMLNDCKDESSDDLGSQILQVLEFAIPIAGRWHERYELQEEDWEVTKTTGKLPEPYEEGNEALDLCIPPVLAYLMTGTSLNKKWKRKIVAKILVPVFELSIAVNTRWLEIFTAKYNLDVHTLDLPLLPVKPKFLRMLLVSSLEDLPSSYLDLYQQFFLANTLRSPIVSTLNKKLLKDPNLRDHPETKHWLSLYGRGPDIFYTDGFNMVFSILRKPWNVHHPEGTTVPQVQHHVFEQAKALLSLGQLSEFENFMRAFEPSGTIVKADWLQNARPVLERIIMLVDSLRTPSWQRNPHRTPTVLPQMLKYKLLLLPYTNTITYAVGLREYVKMICRGGNAYHEYLPVINYSVLRIDYGRRAHLACLLGDVSNGEEMDLVDLLCVGIARDLFRAANMPQNPNAIEISRNVLASWKTSVQESVRDKAAELWKGGGFQDKKWAATLLESKAEGW